MDLTLYKLPQTVFSFREICLLFPDVTAQNLRSRLAYLVKTNKLLSLRRGIYAKPNYSLLELGNKIYRPSYVSLQTVLEQEGIIFQPYQAVFLVSYLSRRVEVAQKIFSYHKIKNEILFNPLGVENRNGVIVASKERAFLDLLFLSKDYYVDNFDRLDRNKLLEILPIYQNVSLEKKIKQYVR